MGTITKYRRNDRTGTRWRARYADNDGQRHERIFTTRADAEHWLREQTAALVRGDWTDPRHGRTTFADYAVRWADDQQHWRASTRTATLDRLRVHVLPTLGALPLARISRSDCQRVINRAAEHLAPSTVEVVHSAMVSVLKAAVLDGIIARNPAVGLRLPARPPRARMVPLTMTQVAELADSIDPALRAMLVLGAATGMRSGELRAVRLDSLSPALHLLGSATPALVTITVDASVTDDGTLGPVKTPAAVREVVIGAQTATVLADHIAAYGPGDHGVLFHRDGTPITRQRAGHAWRAAITAARIDARPRSGWHDLRHAAASTWLSAGLPLAVVSKRLGHATVTETLNAYAWALPDDDARAVHVADDAIHAALG